MFGIVMTVCVASATFCKDIILVQQSEPISPNSCMLQAMPEMAKWFVDHEGYVIKSWPCGKLSQLKASI